MTNQAHTHPERTLPTPDQARAWLQRWDDQQATYFSDRDERFEVICDVLVETVQRPDPLVVDLGVGPGSLARTVLQRIPGATVVGADMDPLLLGLASAAYGEERFRLVQVDLRRDGWLAELDLPRAPDAFISTTALHWLERAPLQRLLRTAAESLADRGVFVDGDHLFVAARDKNRVVRSDLDQLAQAVADRAAVRAGGQEAEDWSHWWDAAATAPELAGLWQQRAAIDLSHDVADAATLADYLDALRQGGCREVGTVWQVGHDRVVVGLR
ncbi:methyltransferase family protein [Barrientosiimonas humi]|uniref:Methyltransferase family protein n=1 Tax=Barrientosiimonas humi TaxID=999931 RepID=A0A542XA61_9MICO|nr:class I SAM-dependent methyltransferase [Barrientosiimonas humi]TQL32717.1 methyltransferase family protein [Barrientosiimonas humi]CAG7572708.1 Trans-aconitate 2-methyltransferase [Barrientosiimonas humi]